MQSARLGRIAFSLALATAFLAPVTVSAGDLMEALDSKAIVGCSSVHRIATCEIFHIDKITASSGGTITLNGKVYRIQWMGPGYYLSNGVILHADGAAASGLAGQRFVEAHPNQGKIHISKSWTDTNADQTLTASDTLVFDSGLTAKVKDVRTNLYVEPLDIP